MTWGTPIRNLLAALAIAAGCTMPAAAQETAEQCAVIADGTARLACYDAIFRTGSIPAGDTITLQSERLIPAAPTGRGPATMIVSCETGGPQVSFEFAGQQVSNTGDIEPVTLQVDQGGTSVRTLRANDANTMLMLAPGRESTAFLDSLAGGTNLKVRMTPVRQRSLTVDFRLPDEAAAIAALRESCPS